MAGGTVTPLKHLRTCIATVGHRVVEGVIADAWRLWQNSDGRSANLAPRLVTA